MDRAVITKEEIQMHVVNLEVNYRGIGPVILEAELTEEQLRVYVNLAEGYQQQYLENQGALFKISQSQLAMITKSIKQPEQNEDIIQHTNESQGNQTHIKDSERPYVKQRVKPKDIKLGWDSFTEDDELGYKSLYYTDTLDKDQSFTEWIGMSDTFKPLVTFPYEQRDIPKDDEQ